MFLEYGVVLEVPSVYLLDQKISQMWIAVNFSQSAFLAENILK